MMDENSTMPDYVRKEIQRRERYLDKYQGCLLGGAIGDALGYNVEFMSYDSIQRQYGKGGIRSFQFPFGTTSALFSDDTQMTLFTAVGILVGDTRASVRGSGGRPSSYVAFAYRDWLKTQEPIYEGNISMSWLLDIPELHQQRAPGYTCLSALRAEEPGTLEDPINDSKGCGGVMRVAPWGLYDQEGEDTEYLVRMGAEMAAITHGHPLGWIPAGLLCFIVNRCAFRVEVGDPDPRSALLAIVRECIDTMPSWFPEQPEAVGVMADLLEKAIDLATSGLPDYDCIRQLGEGWVGEEALAIAVYAALRHADDFDETIIAAVNHDGDSDSTGAICGNIVGALLGIEAIGDQWNDIELRDVILEVAKDLCDTCQMDGYSSYRDEAWAYKYMRPR